ncbi:tail fiber assembly protein [Vibrio gazogenes]|uniref:Phage tail assembly chaperone protein n=1 Tax=Vibrio gazogenes DSM 21264 = NBRC 103151 TaxID=1123492 RepID=A0A1M5AK39_VIBGA|nr:tail fiber assembly protein [Vibrio gazogenes]USP12616.1 phage tail assembly chaperone [Vibrio gazogenes]SHF30583.1 Phage tail assembly chaperone protein [Vibrio gazogenes DSM 21264] [Vibrio gazogenes DSM 21264 = NBRC 103151]SJN57799.1 hypothetical protein BQ6471_02729 [Vibrio gazogenes]
MERIIKFAVIDGKEVFNLPVSNRDTDSNQLTQFSFDQLEDAYKTSRWDDIRVARNRLVSETDWTQIPDAPLTAEKKAEFTAYRQALRDIPQNHDDPDSVTWPSKPTI